jgi:PIN domain nuclease of toxin-antitoxin system
VGSDAVIVLDTHVWIWFNTGDPRLPSVVHDRAAEGAISVLSVWELVMLVQGQRLTTGFEPTETPKRWLERYPFKVLDLDYETVVLSRTLPFEHNDPADRFIASTAFKHGAPLATSNARLVALPWLTTV